MIPGQFDDPALRTLGRILRIQAEQKPDVPFVKCDEGSFTYSEADDTADRIAMGLSQLGVTRGDNVAILAGNRPDLVPLVFGINRLGAVWVPTDTAFRGTWLERSLQDGKARVLCVDAGFLPELEGIIANTSIEHVVVMGDPDSNFSDRMNVHPFAEIAFASPLRTDLDIHYGETSAILWTSGTTGRPKGVMQSHNAWVRASLTGASSARTGDDDVLYCCLPMHNSAAWISVVFRALVAGVPFGLDRSFSVSTFWDRTRHFGATQAFTLGVMHMFLWNAPPTEADADNPVRCMGAIPMPDRLMEPFKKRFGIDIIQQGYGQSEVMGLISRIDDDAHNWNPGTAGSPLPGIEVRLFDSEDREVPVGDVGEFCVRPTEPFVLFNGYFADPEATLAATRNLWYHTGDLGHVDEDGQFYFVDRLRDLIRFKGRSVSSLAVEETVRSHPDVAQVAAFGIPSDELESEAEIMVAVVRKPGSALDARELATYIAENAPYFLVPRYIDFLDELPQTPTGKVQKFLLKQAGRAPNTWDARQEGFDPRRGVTPLKEPEEAADRDERRSLRRTL
ncbi:MAG: AMP-binding protein [Acidimicrobiales bacterium]